MVEHLAVNQRVASSSLAPRATWKVGRVWFIASVLKIEEQKCSVSSNLTLSSRARYIWYAIVSPNRLLKGFLFGWHTSCVLGNSPRDTHDFSSCWVGVKSQPIGCTHSLMGKQIDDGSNPSVCSRLKSSIHRYWSVSCGIVMCGT